MRSRYSSITKNGKYVWTARILLGVMSIVLLGNLSRGLKSQTGANPIELRHSLWTTDAGTICGLPRDPDE